MKNFGDPNKPERVKYLETMMADMGLESLDELSPEERKRFQAAATPQPIVQRMLKEKGFKMGSKKKKNKKVSNPIRTNYDYGEDGDYLDKVRKRLSRRRKKEGMIKDLIIVANELDSRGLVKEADHLDSIITKIAEEKSYFKYSVKRGDTLGQIAIDHGTTVEEIQKANGMDGTDIQGGQSLDIPGDYEAQVIAATLIGEGGSLDKTLMKKIMTIIVNRSKALGSSEYDIVLDSEQFSYWNGKKEMIPEILAGEMGRQHTLWSDALDIAKNKITDNNLGDSTFYYGHAHRIPEEHRSYEKNPDWAEGKCWTEIYRDTHHVYGTNISKPYGDCDPNKE